MKNVLITNASTPLGEALIDLFSHQGYRLAVTVLNPAPYYQLLRYPNTKLYQMSTADKFLIEKAFERITRDLPTIDVLINNIEITTSDPFESISLRDVDEHFQENLYGPIQVIHTAIPYLKRQEAATILNVFSANTSLRTMSQAAHNAMRGFSRALRDEMLGEGIYVEMIDYSEVGPHFSGHSHQCQSMAQRIFDAAKKPHEYLGVRDFLRRRVVP